MIKEFKAFAMKGNVVDMAVGIIIGGAFGKIVASFVSDVLMPPLGLLLGGANFADLKFIIIDNIDQNKRNGNQGNYIFDTLFYKCRFVEESTKFIGI